MNGNDGGLELKEGLLLVFRTRRRQTWQQEEEEEEEEGLKQQGWISHDHCWGFVIASLEVNGWMNIKHNISSEKERDGK